MNCSKCNSDKPPAEFYKGSKRCKDCVRAAVKKNYRCRREQYLAYEKSDQRRASRKFRKRSQLAKERALYPDKYKARTAVSNAIRAGVLLKGPCEICGASTVEGHHGDYSYPLRVRWLCHKHHRELEGRIIK